MQKQTINNVQLLSQKLLNKKHTERERTMLDEKIKIEISIHKKQIQLII